MNTQREVFNKLFKEDKTELATQRIDLAMLDGIERGVDKIYNDIVRADGILSKAGNDAESIAKNVSIKAESEMDVLNKAEDMAKELGINLPKIKELKSRLQKANQKGKELAKKAASAQ